MTTKKGSQTEGRDTSFLLRNREDLKTRIDKMVTIPVPKILT